MFMKRGRSSILFAIVMLLGLITATGFSAGCGSSDAFTGSYGSGSMKIEKKGDIWVFHDRDSGFAKEYEGTMQPDGTLLTKGTFTEATFSLVDGNLVQAFSNDMSMTYERD